MTTHDFVEMDNTRYSTGVIFFALYAFCYTGTFTLYLSRGVVCVCSIPSTPTPHNSTIPGRPQSLDDPPCPRKVQRKAEEDERMKHLVVAKPPWDRVRGLACVGHGADRARHPRGDQEGDGGGADARQDGGKERRDDQTEPHVHERHQRARGVGEEARLRGAQQSARPHGRERPRRVDPLERRFRAARAAHSARAPKGGAGLQERSGGPAKQKKYHRAVNAAQPAPGGGRPVRRVVVAAHAEKQSQRRAIYDAADREVRVGGALGEDERAYEGRDGGEEVGDAPQDWLLVGRRVLGSGDASAARNCCCCCCCWLSGSGATRASCS